MNEYTTIAVFGYSGDAHQIETLMPMYRHHECPIIIVSPEDSKISEMRGCPCIHAGLKGYIGQLTWDRQHLQMESLMDTYPNDFYLLNDADSFCLTPELPHYLYETTDKIFSNEVNDFRIPGQRWPGVNEPWPMDYHAGFPLIAMQPPYFVSYEALGRMVKAGKDLVAHPITPFIDWYMVECAVRAGLTHLPFQTGASCETQTANGRAVMRERIVKYGATFLHAIKSQAALDGCLAAAKARQVTHG